MSDSTGRGNGSQGRRPSAGSIGRRYEVGGPFYEDLEVGREFSYAPAVTVNSGTAAAHRAVIGDRLRLTTDEELSKAVTGRDSPLVSPALVWDIAIGQSTLATQNVIANLYYRDLQFLRFPSIGETLATRTRVVARRPNRPKEGRPPTGLVLLAIETRNSRGDEVLNFRRCAMVPMKDSSSSRPDPLPFPDTHPESFKVRDQSFASWDIAPLRKDVRADAAPLEVGSELVVTSGDCVTSAPELARLTLNIARVHHDASAGSGRRLVYGGHTVGLALAQVTRAIPDLLTVLAWLSCDHLAPVYEGDTIWSSVSVERLDPHPVGARILFARSQVQAVTGDLPPRTVLDWRFVALTL